MTDIGDKIDQVMLEILYKEGAMEDKELYEKTKKIMKERYGFDLKY